MNYRLGINIKLVEATKNDINELLSFQDKIIKKMNNLWFMPLTYQEFEDAINFGKVYFMYSENDIAGLAVLNCYPKKEIIDEYLLDDTLNVGILDSIMVEEKYRGSKLQLQIMNYLEEYAKNLKLKQIVATVHPDNNYSINNFLKANYQIINKLTIHNGIRYILLKNIKLD